MSALNEHYRVFQIRSSLVGKGLDDDHEIAIVLSIGGKTHSF
jgi:hypothetical protein